MNAADLAPWASTAVTLFLGIVGLILANSYRRQTRLRLAERRLDVYGKLWALTEVASPVRELIPSWGPITQDEREKLHADLTRWYYEDGNGLLLEPESRELYLNAKHNLICPEAAIRPPMLADLNPNLARERGTLSMRQLSLLRSQMRADLSVFARWYYRGLTNEDRAFLEYSGVDLNKRPWRDAW